MSGTSPATAIKHDSNKLRMDLIPPEAELALAEILTYGANKYADRNWEKGFEGGLQANWDRIYGALRRHLLMYLLGERLDQESGKPHLWHALCCVAFLVTYEARGMLPLVVTYGRGKDPTAQVTDERGYNEFNSDWRETVIGSVVRRSLGTTVREVTDEA